MYNLEEFIKQVKEVDNNIKVSYDEIDNTIFKGRDIYDYITVDMYGDFIVEKISINQYKREISDDELLISIKNAVNDAIAQIREERKKVVIEEISKRMSVY